MKFNVLCTILATHSDIQRKPDQQAKQHDHIKILQRAPQTPATIYYYIHSQQQSI